MVLSIEGSKIADVHKVVQQSPRSKDEKQLRWSEPYCDLERDHVDSSQASSRMDVHRVA
jgi:hypothetical protein